MPALAVALGGADVAVAGAAAQALRDLDTPRAVQPLLQALASAPAWELRYAAAAGLWQYSREREVTEALVRALLNPEEHEEVRGQAAESLHSSETAAVREGLYQALTDRSAVVRFWSAYALSQVGDAGALPYLQRLQTDVEMVERWRTVGEEACWAIGQIQKRRLWETGDRHAERLDWLPVRYGDFKMNPSRLGPYYTRLGRGAAVLRASEIDALLLTPGADMLYLTGFEHGHAFRRLLALVLRADGTFSWIVPAMNVGQVEAIGLNGGEIHGWTDAETYMPALKDVLQGVRSVAFDDEARAAFLIDLQEAMPAIRVTRAGDLTRELRIRKHAEELDLLRAAAATVDATVEEAVSLCRPGRSEAEVDQKLRAALLRRSPESQVAFTIVASGPGSALPHYDTADRKLERGDVVILDFGTRREGYHSDITVTCCAGEPVDPEVRKVYRVVWEAQQQALAAIRTGVPCETVDRAARDHITAAGYGEFFLHRTGHGLGLQVHEPPYLVGGNAELLEEGMVFSIEPGIYLPGRFGVRLEVIASVGAQGVELINAPRSPELPVAG